MIPQLAADRGRRRAKPRNASRGPRPRVVAILVTFNRVAILERTLDAVQAQTRPPDEIIVVDNASTDATAERLAVAFPDVRVVQAKENLGYGAGLALGLRSCAREQFDFHWLMDDDSRPAPEALGRLLEASAQIPQLGILGLLGGSLRGGWVRHLKLTEQVVRRPLLAPGVRSVDFVLVDGALVTRAAIEVAGVPREDLFMMMEDIEYSHRIARTGFRVGVLENDLMERANLGKTDGEGKALWRGYYKSRNHVRIALESRSPALILGCLARQMRFLASAAFARKRRAERLRLLVAGWRDGVMGRMGRTLEPGRARSPLEPVEPCAAGALESSSEYASPWTALQRTPREAPTRWRSG